MVPQGPHAQAQATTEAAAAAGCEVETVQARPHRISWARQLRSLGFEPKLLAPHLVEPFRRQGKRAKNDGNDAAAICEASCPPRLHTVPIKTPEQQGVLAVNRLREAYKTERTAVINTICGLCAESGVVFPRGRMNCAAASPMRWKMPPTR